MLRDPLHPAKIEFRILGKGGKEVYRRTEVCVPINPSLHLTSLMVKRLIKSLEQFLEQISTEKQEMKLSDFLDNHYKI
jgi:hypothetical protein